MHAAPADLAFGRQPLAVARGDFASLAKRLGDQPGVAFGIFGPLRGAGGRIDAHDSVRPRAQFAQFAPMRQALRTCVTKRPLLRARPWPSRRRWGATPAPLPSDPGPARGLRRPGAPDRRRWHRCRNVRVEEEQIHAIERAPSTSAAAVRRSMVSRPMGGSESGPLPTRPGHMALWTRGKLAGQALAGINPVQWPTRNNARGWRRHCATHALRWMPGTPPNPVPDSP
jgi:hypothetical protein